MCFVTPVIFLHRIAKSVPPILIHLGLIRPMENMELQLYPTAVISPIENVELKGSESNR